MFTHQHFGEAEEAIHLYTNVFENSSIDSLTYHPAGSEHEGKLLFSMYKIDQFEMIAMDGPGLKDYSFNDAIFFEVNCDTQKQIDYYWDQFTRNGGQERRCEWLKDKFGVSWQIIPTLVGELMRDNNKSGRVGEIFLEMKKIDIDQLINA